MGELPQVHAVSIARTSYRILTADHRSGAVRDAVLVEGPPHPGGARLSCAPLAKKNPEAVAPNRSSGNLPTTISSVAKRISQASDVARGMSQTFSMTPAASR